MEKALTHSDLGILIPAAGASSRMRGADKLLQDVDGLPLLKRQVELALTCNVPACVTLPAKQSVRHQLLAPYEEKGLTVILCQNSTEGLAASIRLGAQWAQKKGLSGVMVLLADLPEVTLADLRTMFAHASAAPHAIVRACNQMSEPGHPVIFPQRMFEKLMTLSGDRGANALLKSEQIEYVPLPENHATTDLDTPEEWEAWRKRSR
ncbi:Purine catabolism protein PucB [Roseovarius albus]|uniref:Purine catabolism protein PucB n=1 Tax=Roseovarius albus TaxID=1247867 RepID=A0A1X7A210_9RHOB|nr:nucleotidyltransferase family protein [Roseovarius albus]SLN67876.1 Purine catabolism protein PucB [Roseovarius albus]